LIEEVRVEIGIPASTENIYPRKVVEVRPLVYPEVPVAAVRAAVTEKEFIMAMKIIKLSQKFDRKDELYAMTEHVKAVCDLYICANNYDSEVLSSYVKRVCKSRALDGRDAIKAAAKRVKALEMNGGARGWFERSGQTSFLARSRSIIEFIKEVEKIIEKISL